MGKLRTIILTFLLFMIIPFNVSAATGPAESYNPKATDETEEGAWSYIKVTPVSGSKSRTYYVFSNYQTTTSPIEGVVEPVDGMVYEKESNTLTVTDFKQEDIILSIHNMGTAFTLNITGENELRCIKVDKDKWDSGLTVVGTGAVTLGNTSDHIRIPLEIYGDLELISGSITCLEEISSISTQEGTRYSFMLSSTNSMPITTSVGINGTLNIVESSAGVFLIRTKENITFSGDALQAPEIKRKGKKVSWTKTPGAMYEVSVNGEVTETQKNIIKAPKKKKVSVRMYMIDKCIKTYSPWSKLV